MPLKTIRALATMAAVVLLGLMIGCATSPQGSDEFAFAAQPPLPLDTDSLKPGLAVLYFKHRFARRLDDIPSGETALAHGWTGPPISNLNHQFGREEVFESGTNRGIALELTGYIKLEQAGTYRFQANSNDGIRLYIGSQLMLDDPNWHSDRLTPEAPLAVNQPAWYSLRIRYFQRKGTASLQLYWKPPGMERFSIVPAKVLAHQSPD